jgi:MFS family permease
MLLCLLRFGQGIGLGGEWGGAALLAVENAPEGRRAWFGMFPQLGAPVGFIAANGLFLLLAVVLTEGQFRTWGWRVPFLMSSALLCMGVIFGPMGAVLSELFPTHVRYTGASVTYNMGGILGASFAPLIAQMLANKGGLHWVGGYLIAAALLSFGAIWGLRETRDEKLGYG